MRADCRGRPALHESAHHSARLSPQVLLQASQSKGGWARLVRLLLGRDPAYEPASEAGERPMGVEFWAVSGTGRWLQGSRLHALASYGRPTTKATRHDWSESCASQFIECKTLPRGAFYPFMGCPQSIRIKFTLGVDTHCTRVRSPTYGADSTRPALRVVTFPRDMHLARAIPRATP